MTYRIELRDKKKRLREIYIQNVEMNEAIEVAEMLVIENYAYSIKCIVGNINMKQKIKPTEEAQDGC